jgi:hypothetical protein
LCQDNPFQIFSNRLLAKSAPPQAPLYSAELKHSERPLI